MIRRFITLLFAYGLCIFSASGQLAFDHLTVAGGLSQSSVLSICKDSRGYMWFGTRDRLNRYDAHAVKIFNHDYRNPASISCSDYVFAVKEDNQSNLWIGTVKGLNLYLPETGSFAHFLHNPADPASISDDNIYCIYQDSRGRIWFGTNNGLNMLEGPRSRSFLHFFKGTKGKAGLADNQVYTVYEDHLHNLWVGSATGLTEITFNKSKLEYRQFHSTGLAPDSLQGNAVRTIAEDDKKHLWIGTETGGLNVYNPRVSSFTHYKHDPFNTNSLSSNDVRKIMPDRKGQLWIGTINGLNILNIRLMTFTRYEHDPENRSSLSDNSIKDIYQDNLGSVWVGTTYGGVNVTHPDNIAFKTYQFNKYRNSISGNIVSAIVAGKDNSLWVGTEGNGLNHFDIATSVFTSYASSPGDKSSLPSNFVKAIYRDKNDNLWVGTHQGGLSMYQPRTGNFRNYRHNPADPASLSSDIVSSILEDSRGRFWVGTSQGLNLFDKTYGQFRNYLDNPKRPFHLTKPSVRCIYEDSKHNIWVGTTVGLNLLRAGSATFQWFFPNERKDDSLRVGYINCVKEDSEGHIWVGSFHGGLSKYDSRTNSFDTFDTSNGLPSDNVLNIQQGDRNTLWLSTDNGLARFDLSTHKVRTFTVKDGLPTNEFNYNSSLRDASGRLYLGTYNGLVSFDPRRISESHVSPPIEFTGLKLFNQQVTPHDSTGLLKSDISLTKNIVFRHDQNVFSIEFTALNYNKPERNRFMYKLSGFESNWSTVSTPTATYTNLPAGDYDFLVRADNNTGMWSTRVKSLHIQVLPPLWKTWWAYLGYGVALALVLFLVIRFFRRQARLERDLYYEHLQAERQQEAYQQKLDFFTKISHEIRTPLSLILAPVEKLLAQLYDRPAESRNLTFVKQNTDRLLRLVDELLDFRKTEDGQMKLVIAPHDINEFCRFIYRSFEQLAESRNIAYQYHAPAEPVRMQFDAGQLEKVIYNILSNAFKFTPDGGKIEMTLFAKADAVCITVKDNGLGMSDETRRHIFENFYQAGNSPDIPGWGIGLALAKSIVDLHYGEITVKSRMSTPEEPGETIFTVLLPENVLQHQKVEIIECDAGLPYELNPIDVNAETIQFMPGGEKEKPILLLVEDNAEVRAFMKEALSARYHIHESGQGEEGLALALKIIPDLVISDIAMPVMDGFTLCSILKTDERTNHIPVILLTARADQGNMINGLSKGADSYVTKPFSIQVLELQIRNMLASRETMRQRFSREFTFGPQKKIIESPDEQFLAKAMKIIEDHMENPEFDVLELVEKIGMSQTVLYRKIKALSGMTIADFIKTMRLKQAASLLNDRQLSVAEVAYSVGFNDRKYFSKEFKKQFGCTPSEYPGRPASTPSA